MLWAPEASPLGQLKGIGWEGAGRGFRMGIHMYTCGQLMLTHGKNHHNIKKNYPSIKINKYTNKTINLKKL